ncbi:galactose oxidase [Polyporus arcularius HHB13444]|uniref:Galactose oxidase n=1 Tax=Polyporus arcularius HHB13444 TaxID=1314778 RepID=A0A5C3PSA0_9APHY|nr:galactose oxidase [Polyporus arcularius HHB13444]
MHPLLTSLVVLGLVEEFVWAQQYTAVSRWGQAAALVNDVLYIHGGRTDQYNAYGYSSAPVNNDILFLPLNSSFELSSPPWEYVAGCSNCTTSQGPAVSWHTLTLFNTSELLLFGGDAGPDIAKPEAADSAALLDASDRLKPQWDLETSSWVNEPERRMYHSACESGGQIFIVGGEKTDGSGNAFSDHYVYNPQGHSFTQLPSMNGPPDLLGHACVVLPDRSMLVFGGYSPSENTLLPFSTIWSLDTTQSNYTWLSLDVSDAFLPSPRRGFAAVALDDGKVLIQGGADADMQNIFSDGWVLDTTQSPLVWSSLDALSQVGPRRDHFAVAVGSEVFLGFGYGQFAPANATLLLFDASKGAFSTSYTPPPAVSSPTTTTLPGSAPTSGSPTGTGKGSPGTVTGTGGSSPTGSGTPGDGGNGGNGGGGNGGGDPQEKSAKSHATAVALGVVLGVLGLLAGGGAAFYMSKRHASGSDSFHLLGPSDDDDSPHLGPIIPVAAAGGAREKGLPVVQNIRQKLVGLVPGRSAPQQPVRRDMLADEDTRVFEPSWFDVRREGSVSSWGTAGRGIRPALADAVQDSLTSLRNVGGAMLAYATSGRRKEASGTSSATYWDKEASYDSDKAGLVALPSLASRPKGGRQASYTSQWSYYEDPFADYDVESFKMPGEHDGYDSDAVELHGAPALNDPPPKPYMYSRVAPATVDVTRLTPVSEKPSFTTMSDRALSSVSSHGTPLLVPPSYSNPPSSSENSRSSHDVPGSPRRPSSIIDANPPPIMTNMRRSDTWWSKFAKTPLLERARSSNSSRISEPLDFRDPNPPPRLNPIKESSKSLSPQDPPSKRGSRDDPMYASVHHGRSATSLQTSKTADSAEIENMARTMDIVQKASLSSHLSRASTDSGASVEPPPPAAAPLAVFIPAPQHGVSPNTHHVSFVQSPTADTPVSPPSGRRSQGSVAARVEAFEQRRRSPPSPPEAQAAQGRHKKGRNSVYGLAPKPSLFVANPDRRTSSGDS